MAHLHIGDKTIPTLRFDDIKGTCAGFIYITVNNVNEKMYLGMHTGWSKTYLGSGRLLKQAIKKYGKDNFTRYIIDTATTPNELIDLEHHYITTVFGEDLTGNDCWYNLNNNKQRGGLNSWQWLTEEERASRVNSHIARTKGVKRTEEQLRLMSKITSERMSNPEERLKTSIATKRAMKDPKVRKAISEGKKGKRMNLTEEQRQRMRDRGKVMAKNNGFYIKGRTPWNKGLVKSDQERLDVSKSMRSHWDVLLNGEVIYSNLNTANSYSGMSETLLDTTGIRIGKGTIFRIIKEGTDYKGITFKEAENPDIPPKYTYINTKTYPKEYEVTHPDGSVSRLNGSGPESEFIKRLSDLIGHRITRAVSRGLKKGIIEYKGYHMKEVDW